MKTSGKFFTGITMGILLVSFWLIRLRQQDMPVQIPMHAQSNVRADKPSAKQYKSIRVSGLLSMPATKKSSQLTEREKYEQFLNKHPFNNRKYKEQEGEGEEHETGMPDLAWEQDYLRTMDPALKRPTPEVLAPIVRKNDLARHSGVRVNGLPGTATAPWIERGPNNFGGRTNALVWDPNDASGKKVWAGSAGGGLWFNNDITDANSGWNKIDDFWASISVSSIAFDPNNTQIAYVGTGEGLIGVGEGIGAGIWKTTNGGTNWTQLPSTTNFSYLNDIVVRNEAGASVIYAAVDAISYQGTFHNEQKAGLQRSVDGGTTWTQVLPIIPATTINFVAASIAIAANNRIWIGTRQSPYTAIDRGGGYVLFSDNGTTWTIAGQSIVTNGTGRVTVAPAPSNASIVYAFVEDNRKVGGLYKTTNSGTTWTTLSLPVDADNGIPATDFTRGQANYDQPLKVDPNDPNNVIVGGIDLFRTTNGGNSWSQISKWSENANLNTLTCSYAHADQHAIVFKPGTSSTVIFGTDGGVFYTNSITTAAANKVITERNKNYNVAQFYSVAAHPSAGSNYFLAGAQDNGTQNFTSAGVGSTTMSTGGDGAFCFIDQVNPSYQITSVPRNVFILSTDGGATFPSIILNDGNSGGFINPSCYDNNQHILYTYKSNSEIYRVSNILNTPVVATIPVSLGNTATAFKVSPFTTTSTTLFIGTASGKVVKVTNADIGAAPTTTTIGFGALPTGSVSCIETGSSENELLVTFTNYGINKVWYTANGGTTWVNKTGDLPNIPVRWALFNPNNIANEVILATELGIYGTTNFSNASPTWTQVNNGFANVRTDMLQLRTSDYQVAAATHGRGLYTSRGFVANNAAAPTITSFSPTSAPAGTTISITGTNLAAATAVSFGGITATYTVVSPTLITAVLGAGASGSVNVTTPSGVAASSGFTFIPPPSIVSFTPTSAGVGAVVTITGTGFVNVSAVSFGGTAATSFTTVSTTSIRAIVGNGASGNVNVTTPGGTASGAGFTFVPPPTLSSFTPTSGGAGSVITITGTNFTNTPVVSFGGTAALSATTQSSTIILAVVGAGTTGNVAVTVTGGTASLAGFTYVPVPTITSFTPTSASSGAIVTITGTNFTNASSVSFGGIAATYTILSSTTITAVPLFGSSGNVTVVTPGGTASKAGFTFIHGVPTITSFSPTSAATGAMVTITGTNFTGAPVVSFGGVNATAVNQVSTTTITAIVGPGANGNISVTTPGGTATLAGFTFIPAPVITAFNPTSAGTGATINITGTNFTGAISVSLGGVSAQAFTVVSATSITAIVGAGSSGDVSVRTAGGTGLLAGFVYCPPPTLTAGGPVSFCTGGNVVLTSNAAANNQWFKDGTAINGATNATYTATASGLYHVTATGAGGCNVVSAGIAVTVNPLPATPAVTAGGPIAFCPGGTVVLTSSAASGNQWQKDGAAITGAVNTTYSATAAGSYTVIVTNTNSCSATSAATAVTINALPAVPTITAGGPLSFCDTGKVILTSSAASGNQWYKAATAITGATAVNFTANQSGSYTVVATNASGCSATSAAMTVAVTAIPVKPTITINNADLVSSSASGNQWFGEAGLVTGATAQSYRPSLSGYFKVQVNIAGCISTFSDPYYYLVTAVLNISGNTIGTYRLVPNPAQERLIIQAINNTDKITVQIIDASGKRVIRHDFTGSTQIDISLLAKGMYSVLLTDLKTRKQESKQIIKQ